MADPLRGRYFKLGAAAMRLLRHWSLGDPEQVREATERLAQSEDEREDRRREVVSMIVAVPSGGDVLTATERGYGKRTELDEFPKKGRGTQGVIGIQCSERNGSLVAAVQVTESHELMLISNQGTLVRTRVAEVSQLGRNTQGVTLIRLPADEALVSVVRLDAEDEAEVDSDATLLLVVLKPVEAEVDSETMPVEAEVDSEATLLLVVLKPVEVEVESDKTLLPVVLKPVETEVDRETIPVDRLLTPVLNCATVTMSCCAEPSATLVMRRNAAADPTETSEAGAAVFVRKPVPVGAAAPVVEPAPSATPLA